MARCASSQALDVFAVMKGVNRKTLFLAAGVIAIGGAIALPAFTYKTNCGGNSAALSDVHLYTTVALVAASDNSDHTFSICTATAEQRAQLARVARDHWIPDAHFLVSTNPVFEHDSSPRRIIIVCDTPYRNYPRRWIGSAPPTHAVGYSDGSAGLISPTEFAILDRSSFLALDVLCPPK